MQKAKKKAGGGAITTEKTSKHKTKEEEPISPIKQSNVQDEQLAAEASTSEGKAGKDEENPQSDHDEAILSDAIPAAPSLPSAQETVTTSEAIEGRAGSRGVSPVQTTANPRSRANTHDRQSSLSLQSKIRSDSFRRTSTGGPLSPSANHGALTTLTPDTEVMTDIYRKQALRLEELEKENARLEKDVKDGEARWRGSEEELEELREAVGEASALKLQASDAQEARSEIMVLKAEIAALQRQAQQRSHSHSVSKIMRPSNIPTAAESAGSPDSLRRELNSKDSTIADMELEISRLRSELSTKTISCETHDNQITALKQSLASTQDKLRNVEYELADAKKAIRRASEKAVKEGVEKTSFDTKMKALQRELEEASASQDELSKKAQNLEMKVETMNKLHREAEARSASKLSSAEMQGRESGVLKARLAAAENENLRLREDRDIRKKRDIAGSDDDGIDELEDEERVRLERHVRELESEIFELKRGIWRERRKEMQPGPVTGAEGAPDVGDGGGFDEIDLSGSGPPTQSRNLAGQSSQQKHSSFSTVINSGLAAFRGSPEHTNRSRQDSLPQEFDDDLAFDEEAFAVAQREEEARKMVEHVRDVKRKLRDWEGWRLDLVDARKSAAGMMGSGFGEIFEV